MSDLILELYIEEIPAFMQKPASDGYYNIFTNILSSNDIKYKKLEVLSGVRRIAIHISDIEPKISAKAIEVRGPKTDAPSAAIEGFCKSNNIGRDKLTIDLVKDQEYYFYKSVLPEQNIKDLLPSILPLAIAEYKWPKSMYWGSYDLKWVRPLRNIMCVLDGEVLDFSFHHLRSNNETFGHRFMSYKKIKITSWDEYLYSLKENFVIISAKERREMIKEGLSKLAKEQNLLLKDDEKLLEEVSSIVEYPNILLGKINDKFMNIPSEILITAMRNHQRYFVCYNKDGSFAPYFLFAANIINSDSRDIISGNEKVLSARLSDAAFFYHQDQLNSLESRIDALSNTIFHAKLGSMKDKVDRIISLSKILDKDNESLHKAAFLCKGDLTTEVVSEFPELQGIMGGYYAKLEGYNDEISSAIKYHYQPEGLEDPSPKGMACLLALADKIDSLVSLYKAGERSTGSKDPYALRRYALGIIRIILDNNLNLDIRTLISEAAYLVNASSKDQEEILSFLEARLKSFLKDSFGSEVVNASINLSINSDIVASYKKAKTIDGFLKQPSSNNLLNAYRRASNILNSSSSKASDISKTLLKEKAEQALFESIESEEKNIDDFLSTSNFLGALESLYSLVFKVNDFFDNVTVYDSDLNLANNRIALISKVVTNFHKLADFSEIKQ